MRLGIAGAVARAVDGTILVDSADHQHAAPDAGLVG